MCLKFCSSGHPALPVPAPPAIHRTVLALATKQSGGPGFAQPLPEAATSADGSIVITCAFAGGQRVAFPRSVMVDGYTLSLTAVGHAVGIDGVAAAAAASAAAEAAGSPPCRADSVVAFDMCPVDGGARFVLLAPVTAVTLRATESLLGGRRTHCL